MTQWIGIEKLLKSKKSDNIKIGVSSVAISYACRKQTYSLDVSDSVWSYVDVSDAVKSFKYTLRELINDWSKMSRNEPIYTGGKKIPFSEGDVGNMLRTKKLINPRNANQ